MKIYHALEQGSPEWLALRLGKPTASNLATIMAGGKGDTRRKYLYKLAAERVSGLVEETYKNAHMERGNEQESIARELYCAETGNEVLQVSFIDCDTWGASPDGLIGDNGSIEIKSRIGSVQAETILSDAVPSGNLAQLHAVLLASDRQWIDYVSYSPNMPLFIKRVERSAEWDARITAALAEFNAELEATVQKLQAYKPVTTGHGSV